MKKLGGFKKMVWISLGVLLIVSCEQPDGVTEFINTNDQAGFMSTTGNSDKIIDEAELETISPLLHMSFDGDVSEEQASTKFNEAVAVYLTNNKSDNKGSGTELLYRIWNYTGTKKDNDTDGKVKAHVGFNTNKGEYYDINVILDNEGDDREGGWDYYLIKTNLPKEDVAWVELRNAFIQLQGQDGWYLKRYYLIILDSDQVQFAVGASDIVSEAEVWLDNTCDLCWDTFSTGIIGEGRLNF
ncbi:hypothetical protein [Aquimarina sp. AU119]|uniref:hypothetical protein n=1 Tax=Aquimarina sp. AU119 TaxID=2108528 RepID=UPI000D689028|nr:hypothetical protein [Aquimarina sp. AU119]